MSNPIVLNSIEEALEDIRKGKVVIVVDDEDRENEGDFLAAAEMATPEMINFMATHGRGLICTPLTEERCEELELNMMVENNTVLHHTQFTVSVDLIGDGCTTGISAQDRAKTVKALVNKNTQVQELGRPGHIFPLKAKNGGVLRRTGHTEAAVDLARMAGFEPAGVIVEIMKEDGTMARLPDLVKIAKKFDLKLISIEQLIAYRLKTESLVTKIDSYPIDTHFGKYQFTAYRQNINNQIHIALVKGDVDTEEPVLVRVNSSNTYYDLFLALINGEKPSMEAVSNLISKEGKGAIIFINKIADSSYVEQRIANFKSFQESKDIKPLLPDNLDYGVGAQIISDLGIKNIKLITKNPHKLIAVEGYGLKVTDYVNY